LAVYHFLLATSGNNVTY